MHVDVDPKSGQKCQCYLCRNGIKSEIVVDKQKIHEEMKKHSQRKTVKVTSKLP